MDMWKSLGVVTFLCVCVGCTPSIPIERSAEDIATEGEDLSAEEAAALEKQLLQNPEDLEARIKLLGYYWSSGIDDHSLDAKAHPHIFWLIRNHPEAEILGTPYGTIVGGSDYDSDAYVEGKRLWEEQLKAKGNDLHVLSNSAEYFLFQDPSLTEKSLLKGRDLDPKNHEWAERLGNFYMLGVYPGDGEEGVKSAQKAFDCYRAAYELAATFDREAMLTELAKTAIAAGDLDAAEIYASKTLEHVEHNWNAGNNLHHGNLILGRVALAKGDVAKAKEHLLAAGRTTGSPQLDSFGPNMALALELLKRSERDVVLEYLELCRKFWDMGGDQLDSWSATIKDGGIPDFGANLVY